MTAHIPQHAGEGEAEGNQAPHQMRTPAPTSCARLAASSMFANLSETWRLSSSTVLTGELPATIPSRFSRSKAHSRRNSGTWPASTCKSASTRTGKNCAPSARTASVPHTAVRQRSNPARSEHPSGTSKTCLLPSAPTTKTSTDKLMVGVDHSRQVTVHVIQDPGPGSQRRRRHTRTGEVQRSRTGQNRLPGWAKWWPVAAVFRLGLMPQKSTRRPPAATSGTMRSRAALSSSEVMR